MSVASKPSTRSVTLKKGEKFFLNGALMRVDGPVKIDICTTDSVLLPYHILEEEDAVTPLHKLYFYVQQALIDAKNASSWMSNAVALLRTPELADDFASSEKAIATAKQGAFIDALMQLREAAKSRYGTFNMVLNASTH